MTARVVHGRQGFEQLNPTTGCSQLLPVIFHFSRENLEKKKYIYNTYIKTIFLGVFVTQPHKKTSSEGWGESQRDSAEDR